MTYCTKIHFAMATCVLGALCQAWIPISSAQETAVKVSFLTHWPPETVAKVDQAAKTYTKDHPGTSIQIRAVPFVDLLTTLRSQAGGSNAPTMASIYCLWLPELVRDHIVAEAPQDDAAEIKKDWAGSAVATASVEGKVYGYPNEIDLYALNYNKKLFSTAGINEPPRTWDELLSDVEKVLKER